VCFYRWWTAPSGREGDAFPAFAENLV